MKTKRQARADGSKPSRNSQVPSPSSKSRKLKLFFKEPDTLVFLFGDEELHHGLDEGEAGQASLIRAARQSLPSFVECAAREKVESVQAPSGGSLTPSGAAIDFIDAAARLKFQAETALALALMNAESLRECIRAFDNFRTFDLPGMGEGAFALPHSLLFEFRVVFKKWEQEYQPLAERLRECSELIARLTFPHCEAQFAHEKQVLEAAGCDIDAGLILALEDVIGSIQYCLKLHGAVLGNRNETGAYQCSSLVCGWLETALKEARVSAIALKDAFVAFETHRAAHETRAAA